MDSAVRQVLEEYERRAADERRAMQSLSRQEAMQRIDDFLLPIGPATGELLSLLIKGAAPRTVLEIGTSYGYSTLYLAEAANAVGGKLITIELAEKKANHAREAIARAGLAAVVDFRVGNALDVIETLPGPFDFVLLDLWKDLYVPCLNLIEPKLSAGALIAADNMIFPESARAQAAAYRARVRELKLESILLQVGSGVELSRKA